MRTGAFKLQNDPKKKPFDLSDPYCTWPIFQVMW